MSSQDEHSIDSDDRVVYAAERRREIVDRARRDGRVIVAALSADLGVAEETVRRDLAELERQGLVNRTHGGALPADRPSYEGTVDLRSGQRPEEKARIARRALDELGEAEVVYIDEGSTAAAFAAGLDPSRPLTVITPSVAVARTLLPRASVSVIQLGGELRARSESVAGQWAIRMLSELVLDVAFLGTNGLTREHGLTCADTSVAAVKRTVIAQGRRIVLLADSGKFGRDAFASFGRIADLDTIVTGSGAPRAMVAHIRGSGVQVVIA